MPDICLQHLVALMLVDGKVSFRTTHDYQRMRDPKVLAIRKLVVAVGEESMRDPQRRWNAGVEIHLKDGRTLSNETKAAKGSFANPIERPELEVKALDLVAPVLGKQKAAALLSTLWSLDRLDDVRKLRRLYQK
jgi:2-methylcitrate dehydratase PrpD